MGKIVLDCQKCGGALEITVDMEIFKCPYCGMPYLVERSAGSIRIVHLEEKVEALEHDQKQLKNEILLKEIQRIDNDIDLYLREKAKSTYTGIRTFRYMDETLKKYNHQKYKLLLEYQNSGGKDPLLKEYLHPYEIIKIINNQVSIKHCTDLIALPPTYETITYGKYQIFLKDKKASVSLLIYTDGTIAIFPVSVISLIVGKNPIHAQNLAKQIFNILSRDFRTVLLNSEKEFNVFDVNKLRSV